MGAEQFVDTLLHSESPTVTNGIVELANVLLVLLGIVQAALSCGAPETDHL
jgi:hypothetical protein